MNELIKITENNGQQVVSARELHGFLENKDNVNTWFKRQTDRAMLIENQDFTRVAILQTSGQTSFDYALSISSAKEIAMLNGGEKGKQARQYFIECEKKLKTQSPLDLLKMAVSELEKKELELQVVHKELQQASPKVKYYERVITSNSTYAISIIAKEFGMSATAFNKKLYDMKIQYKFGGVWLLYSKYQDKGYTKINTYAYTDDKGVQQTYNLTVWTEKGRAFLHSVLDPKLELAL